MAITAENIEAGQKIGGAFAVIGRYLGAMCDHPEQKPRTNAGINADVTQINGYSTNQALVHMKALLDEIQPS